MMDEKTTLDDLGVVLRQIAATFPGNPPLRLSVTYYTHIGGFAAIVRDARKHCTIGNGTGSTVSEAIRQALDSAVLG